MKFKFNSYDPYDLDVGNYHAQFTLVTEPAANLKCDAPLRLTLEVLYPL
jgi:hypothetical protein